MCRGRRKEEGFLMPYEGLRVHGGVNSLIRSCYGLDKQKGASKCHTQVSLRSEVNFRVLQ